MNKKEEKDLRVGIDYTPKGTIIFKRSMSPRKEAYDLIEHNNLKIKKSIEIV